MLCSAFNGLYVNVPVCISSPDVLVYFLSHLQLTRLQELEELLKEQESTIASLNEKLEYTKASLQAENRALVLKKDKEIKKYECVCVRACVCVCVHAV